MVSSKVLRTVLAGCAAATLLATGIGRAEAFCGFYVGGGGAKLFNNATQVVLMREGTRTVISMQNNYEGPPENFAMVVPVPVVLQKENVKTLEQGLFAKVDALDAPRLVEYWEQDPCPRPTPRRYRMEDAIPSTAPMGDAMKSESAPRDLGVRVEARFAVGEYEIVILSAQDSGGLETWLKREKYTIPDGAEPYLRPYVQSGSKFFVAKVDPQRVKFDKGMAQLSPLRFFYDAENFSLPVRLGLMNAKGPQDLIVHVLARGKRYEVTNYPNVAIPTNFDVAAKTKANFGSFYAALFDETVRRHPGAVVTEYAWDATTCDPCPVSPLGQSELNVLGADVLGANLDYHSTSNGGFTITRLHARYTKESLGDDLHFREAKPITGGREVQSSGGKLEQGAQYSSMNNFQGRYAVRHPWTGPITCKNPVRGVWGGPPHGQVDDAVKPAANAAFAPRNMPITQFASFVPGANPLGARMPTPAPGKVFPFASPAQQDAGTSDASSEPPPLVADGSVVDPRDESEAGVGATVPAEPPGARGCGGCNDGGGNAGALGAGLLALTTWLARAVRRGRKTEKR
jgi:hypothetical protein